MSAISGYDGPANPFSTPIPLRRSRCQASGVCQRTISVGEWQAADGAS
jgi:hypothetical protein